MPLILVGVLEIFHLDMFGIMIIAKLLDIDQTLVSRHRLLCLLLLLHVLILFTLLFGVTMWNDSARTNLKLLVDKRDGQLGQLEVEDVRPLYELFFLIGAHSTIS